MGMLIAGRTVQGLGGGGVISICYIIIADIAPVDMRPRYQALMMVIYGVASVVGPLIGTLNVRSVSFECCSMFADAQYNSLILHRRRFR
jgi:MFS family permease